MNSDPESQTRPSESYGPIRLPPDSEIILDGEEEIFLLYTQLQGISSTADKAHGLGFLDSTKDVLEIGFDLIPDTTGSPQQAVSPAKQSRKERRRQGNSSVAQRSDISERVEVQLFQDVTALRSRKGDTGSVVWRASVAFAKFVLQQHRFHGENYFFDYERLKNSHVLELGSGTGMLSILLSPLVNRYTVTDVADLVPLIRKNVSKNFPPPSKAHSTVPNRGSNIITVEPLDWISLHSSTPSQRKKLFNLDTTPDLILAVDCIYHPTLIAPLLSTIDHFAIPGQTAVLVVSELRSEDVLREFITAWLAIPQWFVWHVGGDLLRDKRYVLWMGWKPLPEPA